MKKKILLAGAFIAGISFAGAQDISYGFKAGINANNLPLHIENEEADVNIDGGTTGFHAGFTADLSLADNFSIQPNLLFQRKGGTFAYSGKISIYAIDLPINFLYRHEKFFIGAGPNFSYGISAKLKSLESGEEDTDLYKEEGGETPLKRFEVGANVLMGYEFPGGLVISANYTPGLTSILNESNFGEGNDATLKTRIFGFSIGYKFGGK